MQHFPLASFIYLISGACRCNEAGLGKNRSEAGVGKEKGDWSRKETK